jgi:hypothetical protein
MKKILLLSLILTFLACDKTGEKVNGFEISGFIDNAKDGTVIYIKYDSLLSSIDSTYIKDEKFRFNGNVREPTSAILYLEGGLLSDGFWIENTKINIKSKKDSLNKTIIDGGREQTMANLYYSLNRKALNKRDSLEHFYVTNRNKIGKLKKI